MKRAKTSKAWMKEHVNDFFVKQAKKEGYRSRAAYKLIEIDRRDHLFKPGSWSQIAANKVGPNGIIISLDILEMSALPGVTFIRGDFRDETVLAELRKNLGNRLIDLVISDMSPNITGIEISDQARSIYLAELALQFSIEQLNFGGNFLVKVFQGSGFEAFLKVMRITFKKVLIRKPEASRDRSSELYVLGLGKKI
jgi:23S rRNA (uridine2552-2'-O)-methyltransferase